MNNKKNTHLGRKILYALVIVMSGLIIFLNIAGIIGVWTVGRMISNATVAVFNIVENSAKDIQAATHKVDGVLERLQARTTEITDATRKISANVTDKGLVLILLPEEREQQLTEYISSVRDTFSGIKESFTKAVELYRSIDEMPFVNLPSLSEDQLKNIEESVGQTTSQAETLRSEIADFRSGAADKIDKVESAANRLSETIQRDRDRIAQVDSRMAKLEAFSIRIQHDIPLIFNTIFVILSLLFAFVIWTQVEMIRQYAVRWRLLGQGEEPVTLPVETLAQPVAVVPPVMSVAPAVLSAEEPAKPAKSAKPVEKASPAKPAKAVKKSKPAKSAKVVKKTKPVNK
jgi:hypothetical protein